MARDRILVVDDEPLIAEVVSRILTAEGHEVICHSDPVLAAQETNLALVITDFRMPNLNGVELLKKLGEANPLAVRLMLTAEADFKVASDAINRGEVFRLLGKPWVHAELLGCVRQGLAHYHLREENHRLGVELARKNSELTSINQNLEKLVIERTNGLLDGMTSALDYRDTETQWHSRRVSLYSRRIALQVGINGAELEVIEQGALLHDIGKIGVRDAILLKPAKLTPEEWVEMRLHPEIGFRILAEMPYLHDASLIVLQHQERWDGDGYPQNLKGKNIVAGARMFCIADTMDAITSDRPYRKARSLEVASEEIQRCSGTQFDPELVKAFLAIPHDEWRGIQKTVEGLETVAQLRWAAKPIPGPGKLG